MKQQNSIGQMAKAGNCKVQTIRYYEEIGLLPDPVSTGGIQRVYSRDQKNRLGFIRHNRELGFSLDQNRSIRALFDHPSHSCAEVKLISRSHLREVESKLKRPQDMKKELRRMIGRRAGGDLIAESFTLFVRSASLV